MKKLYRKYIITLLHHRTVDGSFGVVMETSTTAVTCDDGQFFHRSPIVAPLLGTVESPMPGALPILSEEESQPGSSQNPSSPTNLSRSRSRAPSSFSSTQAICTRPMHYNPFTANGPPSLFTKFTLHPARLWAIVVTRASH